MDKLTEFGHTFQVKSIASLMKKQTAEKEKEIEKITKTKKGGKEFDTKDNKQNSGMSRKESTNLGWNN